MLTCQASGWAVGVVETTNERGERQIDVPGEWMGGRHRRNGRRVRVDVVVAYVDLARRSMWTPLVARISCRWVDCPLIGGRSRCRWMFAPLAFVVVVPCSWWSCYVRMPLISYVRGTVVALVLIAGGIREEQRWVRSMLSLGVVAKSALRW